MKRTIIDDILDPNFDFSDEVPGYIESICLNCGQKDDIPDFIYDECSRKKYHLKINKRVSTLNCGYCDKESVIPVSYLKN